MSHLEPHGRLLNFRRRGHPFASRDAGRRIKGIKDALGAFFRLAAPVPFDSPDGQPVSMMFVLMVPEAATERHLQLLSELAQMFSDRAFRDALASAPDASTLHDRFTQWHGN